MGFVQEFFSGENTGAILLTLLILVSIVGLTLALIIIFKKDVYLREIENDIRAGHYKLGVDKALKYLKTKTGDFLLYYLVGQAYEGMSQFPSAAEYYEKTLVTLSKGSNLNLKQDLMQRLGNAYDKMGKLETASGYFKLILKENQHHSHSLWKLAGISYQQKKYDQALAYLEKYITIRPGTPEAVYLLGRLYNINGNYVKSIENISNYYNNATDISPGRNRELLLMLAENYIGIRRYPEAIANLKGFLELKELTGDIFSKYIFCLIHSGEIDPAMESVNQNIGRIPKQDRCSILYSLATECFTLGRISKALILWKMAWEINMKYLDLDQIMRKFDALLSNPYLENFFDTDPEKQMEFESLVLRKFNMNALFNILVRKKEYIILKHNMAFIVICRQPEPLRVATLGEIENMLKPLLVANGTIDLYSLFGADEKTRNTAFFKRMRMIEGGDFVDFFR